MDWMCFKGIKPNLCYSYSAAPPASNQDRIDLSRRDTSFLYALAWIGCVSKESNQISAIRIVRHRRLQNQDRIDLSRRDTSFLYALAWIGCVSKESNQISAIRIVRHRRLQTRI